MFTDNKIDLSGHHQRFIYNEFFKQTSHSTVLTVIIAGFGYTIDCPFFYYSKHIPFDSGNDVFMIDFQYSDNQEFLSLTEEQQDNWFNKEVSSIAQYLLKTKYTCFNFIGKSLGTTTIFKILSQIPSINDKTQKIVWLTPGTYHTQIYKYISDSKQLSLIVYGSNDPYTTDFDIQLSSKNPNVSFFIIPNADHGLECSNVQDSLHYLQSYIDKLQDFYKKPYCIL